MILSCLHRRHFDLQWFLGGTCGTPPEGVPKVKGKQVVCEFGVTEVDFLGHRITQEGLNMDDHKVKAIVNWEPPKSVSALRSFLGLASYYRKFIKNFAKIAAPLTNLLKKSAVTYEWEGACDKAFETLKGILVEA